MKFTVATIFALIAVAFAYPAVERSAPIKRQNIVSMDVSVPAMSSQDGAVVPFNAANVHQDARTKGI
ncbi:hypothetical protein N656DRAFT_798992 [Canariomyces notabilis]|uniref:Mating factor alpha n=1 Tax=Canariomyces notabilis TaxID=2074819 RepID=A0AAN6TC32_9PEZI|nr:hypothetical protein N656DRAFT_798992 [Canariomyces arenarius]